MSPKNQPLEAHRRRSAADRVKQFNKHFLTPVTPGTATLRSGGLTHVVTEPRIIDAAEAFTQVSPAYAQAWCRSGIARYLKLRFSGDEGH